MFEPAGLLLGDSLEPRVVVLIGPTKSFCTILMAKGCLLGGALAIQLAKGEASGLRFSHPDWYWAARLSHGWLF